jgi:hypothetical protein
MSVGEKFTHNGIEYTVSSIPEPGVVKAMGFKTIVDPDPGHPDSVLPDMICIAEGDITP